jgi:uncharacterized protein YfkK (UPF0435 family)
MGLFNNSKGINNPDSIYDITHKLEEELTYIYEMRMKQNIKSPKSSDGNTDNINTNPSNILKDQHTISLLAR